MNSTEKQLETRGYFSSKIESEFAEKSFNELIELLNSKSAVERTVGARLLTKTKNPKYFRSRKHMNDELRARGLSIANSKASRWI